MVSISTTLSASCNNQPAKETNADVPATTEAILADTTNVDSSLAEDHAILYLTIADTGRDYFLLREKMFALHQQLNWPIDTMRRYFDKKKQEIVLPDNDEDELYRGQYFPRRFPSEHMSLENYITYAPASTDKNIALVAGIYETKTAADSVLAKVRPHATHAFVIEANVYVGCMH